MAHFRVRSSVFSFITGTTYSCIGAYHAVSGHVDVLADSDGHKCIPSVVAFRYVLLEMFLLKSSCSI